jgi:hypothetical protein
MRPEARQARGWRLSGSDTPTLWMTRAYPLAKTSSTTRTPHGPSPPPFGAQTPPHAPENLARSVETSAAGGVIVTSAGRGVARAQSFAWATATAPISIAASTARAA